MLAATLDELTGGRFNLGLAAGAADFLGWVGLARSAPVATMRETITAVRALLAGERAPAAAASSGRRGRVPALPPRRA